MKDAKDDGTKSSAPLRVSLRLCVQVFFSRVHSELSDGV